MQSFAKYNAKKVEIDGHKFDSKREGARYLELKLLEKAGKISDLKLHPKFPIILNEVKICNYIADFQYTERGLNIVEDIKGWPTPVFRLKAKLFTVSYPELELLITK